MKIQYCIITKDKAGQTIQIFDTIHQAKNFMKALSTTKPKGDK